MTSLSQARMECLPDQQVPAPAWSGRLAWEASPPFRVNWVNTASTDFHGLGYLTNSYNENSVVFYGRDGQEIEPMCGVELCSALDNNLKQQEFYGKR